MTKKLVRAIVVLALALGVTVGGTGLAVDQDAGSNDSNQSSITIHNGTIGSSQGQSQDGGEQTDGTAGNNDQTNSPQSVNEQSNNNVNEPSVINGDDETDDDASENTNSEPDAPDNSESTIETSGVQNDDINDGDDEFIARLLERLIGILASLLDGNDGAEKPGPS